MRIALPISGEDLDPHRGKIRDAVVTETDHGEISFWEPHEVEWGRLHDEGPHGTYRARIVRFLTANKVDTTVIDHAGQSMLGTVVKMGLRVITGQMSSARQMVFRTAAPRP